jgi:hypothetical protein
VSDYVLGDTGFNWRRELLLLAAAAMETSWLAGWTVVLLADGGNHLSGGAQHQPTTWFSLFGLYLLATTTARTLARRPTRYVDWILVALVASSTLVFLNLNLYSRIFVLNPRWVGEFVRNIVGGPRSWPLEFTALLIGFFAWFRGMRLHGRYLGVRTMMRQLQLGLFMVVVLAIASTKAQPTPVNINGVIVVFFATSLLALALTRLDETARTAAGVASRFGRKWVATLAVALLVIAVLALIGSQVLTVDTVRTVLRPVVLVIQVVLGAVAVLVGLLGQYVLFPLLLRLLSGLFGEGLELKALEGLQQEQPAELIQGERAQSLLTDPTFLNALRVVGLALLALILLWLVVRSFRRWRQMYTTAGGTREAASADGSLAGDVASYLRDRWRRLREAADVRRMLRLRNAGSIRAIYTNMLTLMAVARRPRQLGQTPYEYEPIVTGSLPEQKAEVEAITDAYVRARYGERDIDPVEFERLRDAWQRVRDQEHRLIQDSE